MATIKKYNGSSWENAVVRKFGTATEAVENPLYSDGTAITAYTLKGNEEHTGTPTPSNPVMPNGVGEKTENLFDFSTMRAGVTGRYLNQDGTTNPQASWNITDYIPCDGTEFTIRLQGTGYNTAICLYDADKNYITGKKYDGLYTITVTSSVPAKFIRFSIGTSWVENGLMLNTGSTAKPYEPYGFKIPISSGQQTTPIYLGSTQTVRAIKKVVLTGDESFSYDSTNNYYSRTGYSAGVSYLGLCTHYKFSNTNLEGDAYIAPWGAMRIYDSSYSGDVTQFKTWLAAQYANGTPVTFYYVLATPETAAVNEPLMKIGTYADTLSNAASIPTTEGANSITVDTTVQPSEFTATWTGWHDASVKEYDGSQWNE